ncbi:MAG: class I SAM-dependent methyltransferase [Deltaproteobacteria bacterium]|nr:class I SAM-dependent methyltransferase [Deltaproteobacteria bacterium]
MEEQKTKPLDRPPVRLGDEAAVLDALAKVRARRAKLEKRRAKKAEAARGKKGKSAKKVEFSAKTADHHELYQRSVQSPVTDIKFLRRLYKKLNDGREPEHFREDFCGTGLLSATWVGQGEGFTAEGFDLDPDPVAWGLDHNFARLGAAAGRYLVHLADVREPSERKPDVRCAQNFSWFVFKTRDELLGYFRKVHDDLPEDGVFVMDIQGGREAQEEMEEEIDHGDWTYVWDQDAFHPVTSEYETKIHFRFPDGTEIRNAFRYDWRLWNLTETLEVLADAGFTRVETYWEGTDKDGESGNGVFKPSRLGENCLAWVTYIVAQR